PVRNTRFVELRYRSVDPAFAARAANAVAEQYRQQNLQTHLLASKEMNAWLDRQIAEQQRRVQETEMQREQCRGPHDLVASADATQTVAAQRLADLYAERVRKQTERFQKEAVYQSLLKLRDAQKPTLQTAVDESLQAAETDYLAAKAAEDSINQ